MKGDEKKEKDKQKTCFITTLRSVGGRRGTGEDGSGSRVKSGSQWWGLHNPTARDMVGAGLASCRQGSGVVDCGGAGGC